MLLAERLRATMQLGSLKNTTTNYNLANRRMQNMILSVFQCL